MPDIPAAPGNWGVLKVSAVHANGYRPSENKALNDSSPIESRYEVRPGDLLFSRANTPDLVGSACIATASRERLLLSDKTLRLVVNPALADVRYVCLSLSSHQLRQQIINSSSGSSLSMQNISQGAIEGLALRWPPLAEQRRIVDVVDAMSAQEYAIEASIAKMRSVRQGTLLASMTSVGGGELPRGWARMPLKDVVPEAEYGISNALDQDPRGIPVLRMNNLRDGRPELSDLRYSPVSVPGRLELRRGDVLFNRTNSIEHIGKSAMWRAEIPRATFASYLVRINPDKTRLIPEYLVEWLMHPLIRQRVQSISTVAVQQVNVNPTRLRELEIDMPVDLVEQRRIIDLLSSCDEQIQGEQAELNKVRTLRLGLVDDLLAGSA
ncbi:restriction endonuclease subunit S [Kitasatospora sp. NPDC058397]|uniref:restriction endonuclease subunit S n=1 Tax=unclassified Kitasatospora TaxID=2633591 RepID=UPI003658659C